jgi:hypothetical protein
MTDDDTRWADRLLERARDTAAPRAEDAARNLASIEARLGMGPGVGAGASETAASQAPTNGAGRSIAAGGLGVSSVARVGLLQSGGLLKSSLLKGGLLKGGLVLAFGVATGIVGYLIGRAETAQNRAEIAVDAAAALAPPAAPVATSGDVVAPALPSPVLQAEEAQVEEAQAEEASAAPPPHRSVAVARRAHRVSRGVSPSEREASALAPPASKAASAVAAPTADRAEPFPLSEALELLRRAEAAVRRSDGLEAKMWLSDLDRRAAPQLLVEERLVTLTLAQCVLDDVEAARETLRELESANAESIYRARLEGSCVADRMQGGADRKRGR